MRRTYFGSPPGERPDRARWLRPRRAGAAVLSAAIVATAFAAGAREASAQASCNQPGQTQDVCYTGQARGPLGLKRTSRLDVYVPEKGRPLPPAAAAPRPDLTADPQVTVMFGDQGQSRRSPDLTKYQPKFFNNELNNIYVTVDWTNQNQISRAISWVSRNVGNYGGTDKIHLIGVGRAADHIAELMLTNRNPGFDRSRIAGVTVIGGESYPRRITVGTRRPFLVKYSQMTQKALNYAGRTAETPEPANTRAVNAAEGLISMLKASGRVARPWKAQQTNARGLYADIGKALSPETQVQQDFVEATYGSWVFQREIKFETNNSGDSRDENGNVWSGTSGNQGVYYDGKLYAPFTHWNQAPVVFPFAKFGTTPCGSGFAMNGPDYLGQDGWWGAYTAVKDGPNAKWKVDNYFGKDTLRVGGLDALKITTDGEGNKLAKPVEFLGAGLTTLPGFDGFTNPLPTYSFYKINGGPWKKQMIDPDSVIGEGGSGTGGGEGCNTELRLHMGKVNSKTGVYELFAAASTGRIYRGTWDVEKQDVVWGKEPEVDAGARGRPLSWTVYNDRIVVGSGLTLVTRDDATGEWREIYQWPGADSQSPRGLTLAPDPEDPGKQVMLVTRVGQQPWDGFTDKCKNDIVRFKEIGNGNIDVDSAPVELDITKFYEALWGSTGFVGQNFCINVQNYWKTMENPRTGKREWLGGQWVEHPTENWVQALGSFPNGTNPPQFPGNPVGEDQVRSQPPFNGAWMLYRPDEGGSDFSKYGNQLIFDYDNPHPVDNTLMSVRWVEPSPWSKREYYVSGYDGYVQTQLPTTGQECDEPFLPDECDPAGLPAKAFPSRVDPGYLYKAVWSKDIGY